MRNKMEMGGENNPEKSIQYLDNVEELIVPFIIVEEDDPEMAAEMKTSFGTQIAEMLDANEDDLLLQLRSDRATSFLLSTEIKMASSMLKDKKIKDNAPWLEIFRKKIAALEILTASTDYEMNRDKFKEAIKKKINRDSGDSTKK